MKQQTVLITGASGGLGSALALHLDSLGHRLILHKFRNALPGLGDRPRVVIADLRTIAGYARLVQPNVDVFINNAATYNARPITEFEDHDISGMSSVNLITPMYLTQALWPTLSKNEGIIININSLAAKVPGRGESIYAATKAGLAGFFKSLQFEATEAGIQIVDVFVGAMQTKMASGRANYDKLMDPVEVAQVIGNLIENRDSLRVTEITLMRKNY